MDVITLIDTDTMEMILGDRLVLSLPSDNETIAEVLS
jgi:hypothetical protein